MLGAVFRRKSFCQDREKELIAMWDRLSLFSFLLSGFSRRSKLYAIEEEILCDTLGLEKSSELLQECKVGMRDSKDKYFHCHLSKGTGVGSPLRECDPDAGFHAKRFYVKSLQEGGIFRCDVWTLPPTFVCLEWNRSPTRLFSGPYWLVSRCPGTHAAASQSFWYPASGEISGEAICRVESFLEGLGSVGLAPPAGPAERIAFTYLWRFLLPEDYIALLSYTNSFMLGGWKFRGTNARTVVLPEYNLLVLAEKQDEGAICAVEGEEENCIGLRYFSWEHEERNLPSNFLEALRSCIER